MLCRGKKLEAKQWEASGKKFLRGSNKAGVFECKEHLAGERRQIQQSAK